jgi:hypothetical protein
MSFLVQQQSPIPLLVAVLVAITIAFVVTLRPPRK